MADLSPSPKFKAFVTGTSTPLAGGKLYTYLAGTTTPQATAKDLAGTANTNPVILDANGECDLWLGGFSFKIILKDSLDVQQWSVDNIRSPDFQIASAFELLGGAFANTFTGNGATLSFTLSAAPVSINVLDVSIDGVTQIPSVDYTLLGSVVSFFVAPPDASTLLARFSGALTVGVCDLAATDFIALGAYAVVRKAQTKMQEHVTPEDFGAVGDGITDDTVKFQNAINALSLSSSPVKTLMLAAKKYRIVGTLSISAPINIVGQSVYDLENTRGITVPDGGSWLIHANPTGTMIQYSSSLSKGASLSKFGIFQEGHSVPGLGWTPAVRDWVIRNENTQGTLNIDAVHFHNVYKGVLTDFAVRPRYKNLTGQFFFRGFSFDRIYDIGSFDGLHAWTYWSEENNVLQWTQANGVEITILRTDGLWMSSIFAFAVSQVLYFGTSAYGGTGRVIVVDGLYSDFCGRAVTVDSSAAHVQISNMFHLGQAWPPTPTVALNGSCAVHVASGSNSLVQVGSVYCVLTAGAGIKVEGTYNQVWVGSEIIEQYDVSASGVGAHYIPDATNAVKLATVPSLNKYGGGATAEITGGAAGVVIANTPQKLFGNGTVNRPVTTCGAAGVQGVLTVEGEANASLAIVAPGTGFVQVGSATNGLSFYGGGAPIKGTLTGAKAGNVALTNLITYLAARGLFTDSTT